MKHKDSHMSDLVRLELQPLGKTLTVPRHTPLQEVLFEHGVEFPCGGRGRCRGCKVKVVSGHLAATPEQALRLSAQELAAGWRLACRCSTDEDLVLDLAQWEAAILADNSVFEFTPQPGLGMAVDLGTTTLVAQLLDLTTGHVLGVRTALNDQARHGADIMSRINFALADNRLEVQATIVRHHNGPMVDDLLTIAQRPVSELRHITVVGNTAMHHLFCKLDPHPLSHYPFEPVQDGLQIFTPPELGWRDGQFDVRFLPCLGGFVGSDILAGILATHLHQSQDLSMLIDLGTNGEIVLGNQEKMLCASTAAGPAFEGARISMGMRAATGAISEIFLDNGRMVCRVLGGGPPRGICGSGLVDAVAACLELGQIQPSGRFANKSQDLLLSVPVKLTQADVRELQLAKGAIAAGIRILLEFWGATITDVRQVYLAGAFGNYINRENACRIGLFSFGPEQVQPSGNTALLGAKLALFEAHHTPSDYRDIRRRVKHLSLSADPRFQEVYLEEMQFPAPVSASLTTSAG